MISVDLDRASTLHLLRTYLSVPQAFSVVTRRRLIEPYNVFHSPSGVGFHIKIQAIVSVEQNLKIRALLWDHAERLMYALKKWALNPEEAYVDLCFDEKNDGLERMINMQDILQPFQGQIRQVLQFLQSGKSEKAESIVHKVANSIDPAIQSGKRKQFVGCIAFKGDQLREWLEEICIKISAKDATFKWRVYPCFFPEFDWMLCIFTDSEKLAWERITWLKNKACRDEKLILKDADTRLWVKERIAT